MDATDGDDPASDNVILDVVTPEALLNAMQKATPSEDDDVIAPPHPKSRDT